MNLANLDDINYISVTSVATTNTLTISNAQTGVTVELAEGDHAGTTVVQLANAGSSDVATIKLTDDDGTTAAFNALTFTGFETLNFSTTDAQTIPTGAAHQITTLTDADATSITVTGNAGLNLGTFAGTALTSFNASGVTLGSVTYTSGVLASASTITGGAGADTLSAAAAVATVSLVGGAGIDTLTGSATKASTIDGGAGNDILTGGAVADSIVGGDNTDTFVFSSTTVVEQVGSSTTTGVVINLSAAAITSGDVNAAVGGTVGLTGAQTSVASNTATYLYSAESNTNASVIDTLISIENATGTELADYIVGSTADNTITGGDGTDTVTGGTGADTFSFIAAEAGDGDVITDFAVASDFFDYNTALKSIDAAVTTPAGFQNNVAAGTAIGVATSVYELVGTTTTDGTAVDLVSKLGAAATNTAIDSGDKLLFVNYLTAGGAQVWQFVDADNASVGAGELTLIATLTGVAASALTTTNFI